MLCPLVCFSVEPSAQEQDTKCPSSMCGNQASQNHLVKTLSFLQHMLLTAFCLTHVHMVSTNWTLGVINDILKKKQDMRLGERWLKVFQERWREPEGWI